MSKGERDFESHSMGELGTAAHASTLLSTNGCSAFQLTFLGSTIMCVIIHRPVGAVIPARLLKWASLDNPDGYGLMYHDGQSIVTEKNACGDYQELADLLEPLETEVLVHLRLATVGEVSWENTHPIEVLPEELYLMHNGTFDRIENSRGRRSDTRIFVEDHLRKVVRNPHDLERASVQRLITHFAGHNSVIVFLDGNGRMTFFNKDLGMNWKGLWLSNRYTLFGY